MLREKASFRLYKIFKCPDELSECYDSDADDDPDPNVIRSRSPSSRKNEPVLTEEAVPLGAVYTGRIGKVQYLNNLINMKIYISN